MTARLPAPHLNSAKQGFLKNPQIWSRSPRTRIRIPLSQMTNRFTTISWRSNALLVTAAAIWGVGFVAQSAGMRHTTPMAFNAARHLIGFLALAPFALRQLRQGIDPKTRALTLRGGTAAGVAMFAGAGLQQAGIVTATAGNTAFITGLYVIIVPILGLFWKHKIPANVWMASALAVAGLYLITGAGAASFSLNVGEALVLLGAFAWAVHVIVIGAFTAKAPALPLAAMQFLVCAVLSAIASFAWESTTWNGLVDAAIPILYLGFFSIGLGFTLQIIGQRNASPSSAAIILSLEAVFGAIAGSILLGETWTQTRILGSALMFAGMATAQIRRKKQN